MQNTTKLLAAAMALPLAIGLTVPATAAPRDGVSEQRGYNQGDRRGNGWSETRRSVRADHRRDSRAAIRIERRLDSLKREIRQARRSGVLNRYQARNFRHRLESVTRGYYAFARNGLSRRDVRITMRRIGNVSDQLETSRYRFVQRERAPNRRDVRRGYYRR